MDNFEYMSPTRSLMDYSLNRHSRKIVTWAAC